MDAKQLLEEKQQLYGDAKQLVEKCDKSIEQFDIRNPKIILHVILVSVLVFFAAIFLFFGFNLLNYWTLWISVGILISVACLKIMFLRWGYKKLIQAKKDCFEIINSYEQEAQACEKMDQ